jgi:hypothetical protein
MLTGSYLAVPYTWSLLSDLSLPLATDARRLVRSVSTVTHGSERLGNLVAHQTGFDRFCRFLRQAETTVSILQPVNSDLVDH